MFCIECGKPLPDGAKFCAFCGTKQEIPQTFWLEDSLFDQMFPPVSPSAYGRFGCSEKQGNMVYVPEKGIFFIHEKKNICFVPEKGGKVKFLTKKSKYTIGMDGLNYYQGKLYYLREFEKPDDSGTLLMSMDVDTYERQEVKLSDRIVCSLNSRSRFSVRDGIMYAKRESFPFYYEIVLDTGEVRHKDLPDMQTKVMPEDWESRMANLTWPSFEERKNQANYGFKYNGLTILNDYGYVDMLSFPEFAIRFPLDDPTNFEYMPAGSCDLLRTGEWDMFSSCQGGILSVSWGLPDSAGILRLIKINENKISGVRNLLDLNKYKQAANYWWKVSDDLYFIGNLMLNLATKKLNRVNFCLEAEDFAPAPDGGTYVMTGEGIYCLPMECWTKIKNEDDLKHYIIAPLNTD